MNLLKIVLIILSTRLPILVTASNKNGIKIIGDLLQTFNKPSNVLANLCWRPWTKKKFMSDLAGAVDPKSIKFTNIVDTKDLLIREKTVFLVDITCPGIIAFLRQVNSSRLFAKPFRWVVMSLQVSERPVPAELDGLHILPDSEVYIVQYNQNDSYSVDLVYKIKPHLGWIIENYGVWTRYIGLIISRHIMAMSMPMRRKNLSREIITTSVVVLDNNTLGNLEDLRYPEIDTVSKSGYRQLSALYDFINATRQMIYIDVWGYFINGSWTGILGHLVQEKAELPGSIMFITKERMAAVEYLTYPTPITVKFIFREPPLSYQNNLYLLPFKATVWCCIGSFVVIMVIVIYVNAYWEERKLKNENNLDTSALVPKVSDVTVVVMSAISQQGSAVELKGTLGRFVFLVLFVIFLFLYTAYSASIVVLLQSSSNQIRTLSDLLQSKLELGVEDTPYNRYIFATFTVCHKYNRWEKLNAGNTSGIPLGFWVHMDIVISSNQNQKEPIRKAIYEKKIAPPGSKPKFYDIHDGVQQLQKKPFAFHCNLGAVYNIMGKYFQEHEKCGLQEISYVQDSTPWQACRKGSPYLEIFKIGLLRNAEFGLNDRTNRLIFSKKPVCIAPGGSFVSVSLVDCYPILLLLIYGMISGVLILIAEVIHHRRNSSNIRKTHNVTCSPDIINGAGVLSN